MLISKLFLKKAYKTFKEGNAVRTFILALDGDVDFKPDAVERLLDRMLKNPDVGASCGRIIPKGSGIAFLINSIIIISFKKIRIVSSVSQIYI